MTTERLLELIELSNPDFDPDTLDVGALATAITEDEDPNLWEEL